MTRDSDNTVPYKGMGKRPDFWPLQIIIYNVEANIIKGTIRSFIIGLHKAERQVSSRSFSKCLGAESTPVSAAVFFRS